MRIWTLAILVVLSQGVFAKTKAKIRTNLGVIDIELYDKKAPETVKNFKQYIKDKFYDGVIFHRVIKNFMVQAGGFDQKMRKKKTLAPIKNEAHNGLKNLAGTHSMARTNDIHSATSQFFINAKNNPHLDHKGKSQFGYAVFGKVMPKSMKIVHAIENTPTSSGDKPLNNIVIESITIEK